MKITPVFLTILHYLEEVQGKLGVWNLIAGSLKYHYMSDPLLTTEHGLVNKLFSWNRKKNEQKLSSPNCYKNYDRNTYDNMIEYKKGLSLDLLNSKDLLSGDTKTLRMRFLKHTSLFSCKARDVGQD